MWLMAAHGFMLFLLGLFLLLVGLFQMCCREAAWSMHVAGMRSRGIVNLERTESWDFWRRFAGFGLVCMALLVWLLAFVTSLEPARPHHTHPNPLMPGVRITLEDGTELDSREFQRYMDTGKRPSGGREK